MRRRLGAAALALALGLALIGCDIVPGAAPNLGGTTWHAISIAGRAPVGPEPTAVFEDGLIRGTTGCNNYGGRVTINGTTLTVTELGGTAIGCPEPTSSQEALFLKALGTARTIRLEGPNLVIAGDAGEIVFRPGGQR